MWRLFALLVPLTACGIDFQSSPADGGADAAPGGSGGATTSVSSGGAGDAGGAGGSSASSGGAGGAGGGATPSCQPGLEIPATVADCIRHSAPNPDDCEIFASEGPTGVGEMDVDESADSTAGNIVRAYLRFELPAGAKGASGFTLRLVNTGITNADSPGSGAIYVVQPFVRNDLFAGPPAQVTGTAVAPGQGSVTLGETVDWPLPASVAQGASVFLEVVGTDPNGVRYWNNNGAAPPKLIVACP